MDRNVGYKVKRSTIVLALSSMFIRTNRKEKLTKALEHARAENFDFERMRDRELEILYAGLDDEVTEKVLAEFRFIPRIGNVRDLGGCYGTCALCGKGDSKDEGDNRDHLRYEFKLSNNSGGEDVWTGSTCIINHHLKVDGAANAEQAKNILEKALREHIAMWKREAWRAENGDHEKIPSHWAAIKHLPSELRRWGAFARYETELLLVGFDRAKMEQLVRHVYSDMRSAARFYQRKAFLTDMKTVAWMEVKKIIPEVERAWALIREAEGVPRETRFAWFKAKGEEYEASRPRPRKARELLYDKGAA